MRVILRVDDKVLGKRGDIVDVSDGHARNYLLPKGLAIVASDGAVSQAASMRRARDLRDAAHDARRDQPRHLCPAQRLVPEQHGQRADQRAKAHEPEHDGLALLQVNAQPLRDLAGRVELQTEPGGLSGLRGVLVLFGGVFLIVGLAAGRLRAAAEGNLALMECNDAVTDEPRYVICAVGRDGADFLFTPFGHLADGNPYDAYLPPPETLPD